MREYNILKLESSELWVLVDEDEQYRRSVLAVFTRHEMNDLKEAIKKAGF